MSMKFLGNKSWLLKIILGMLLFFIIGIGITNNIRHSYWMRIKATRTKLLLGKRSIHLFFKHNSRFPKSLDELYEYGDKFPNKIQWMVTPEETISKKRPDSSEHSILDGTGGLYYNPENGELKVNLTKPLKSYFRFYFGEKRNEVPSDW